MTNQVKDPNNIHVVAELSCGTRVEVTQPERGMNLTVVFTPSPGIPVNDFADLKNGCLNTRVTEESLVGLYQLLRVIVDPPKKSKLKSFLETILGV